VSYDVYFMRRDAGRSAEEIYEDWSEAQEEETPAEALTPGECRTIADALLAAGLGLQEFEKDYDEIAKAMSLTPEQARAAHQNIELNVPEDSNAVYQIDISAEGVSITIPYWERDAAGTAALNNALTKVYAILNRADLVGYDPQLEREAVAANFPETNEVLTSTRQAVLDDLHPKKPWWKFW
jgi:hypothetical protein